jgi:hypothetical protein
MYKVSTLLRASRDLKYKGATIAKGSILTDAQMLGMKTLQSLLAKRWVVPVQDPSARRLPGARQRTNDGIYNKGVLSLRLTDSSDNNSVKYTAMPTYLNPAAIKAYAVAGIPYAVTGTGVGQSSGSYALSWYEPINSPASITVTDYYVQYKLSTATSWTTNTAVGSKTENQVITGLTGGGTAAASTYDFRVAAVVGGTTGTYSAIFSAYIR